MRRAKVRLTGLFFDLYQVRGSFCGVIPHEASYQAVYTVSTKKHIARLNMAASKVDINPVLKLLHIFDDDLSSDERHVG